MAKQQDTKQPTPPATDGQDEPQIAGPSTPPKALDMVPEANGRTEARATSLLLDACEKFGVNPGADCRPLELKAWRFYPGDRLEGIPDAVSLVTAGGVKIRHFADPNYMAPGCLEPAIDQDTEDRLRRLFGAVHVDPKTKDVTPAAFPTDLTLPASAVDGRVRGTDHTYRGGYLKAGGKEAAAKRGR